ncbi:MAG: hypothetical protein ABUK01_13555 [Leptospirales bacterium]
MYKQSIYTQNNIDKVPQVQALNKDLLFEIKLMANILPFRVNNYVIENLIDWEKAPDDPIFRMMFPSRDMISEEDFSEMVDVILGKGTPQEIENCAQRIRSKLNPHPGGQSKYNVPHHNGSRLEGVQHKYKETVLLFPKEGKVCFSYCMFCFRWAQFVNTDEVVFSLDKKQDFFQYISEREDVTDLLITGGDPMVMRAEQFAQYIDELCKPDYGHIKNIRIGTKVLSFWPHRFTTDPDADDLLRLFEKLNLAGKHVTFMAHFNHYREMENDVVTQAIKRIQNAGIIIRSQSPILRHVNDAPGVWTKMWNMQLELGIIPYYMFIERNTGANKYYELPLGQVSEIFRKAVRNISGLGKTVKGPVMSAANGKVEILGTRKLDNKDTMILRYVQCRDPELNYVPFFAEYKSTDTWFDQLYPLNESDEAFFNISSDTAHDVVSFDEKSLLQVATS